MSHVIPESVRDNPTCPQCGSVSYYEALCSSYLSDQRAQYERDDAVRRATHEKKIEGRDRRKEHVEESEREYRPVPFVEGTLSVGPFAGMISSDLRNAVETKVVAAGVGCGNVEDFRLAICNKQGCGYVWLRHIEIRG